MTDQITAAMEAAETEDTVGVILWVPTGITLGGKPHPTLGMVSSQAEVTLSGLMEIQAILERGGLVDPGNVVNEAEQLVSAFLRETAPGRTNGTAVFARDIVAVLAEKGLLR